MKLTERHVLDAFLWFQTASLMSENLQTGVLDAGVTAINGAFVCLFGAYVATHARSVPVWLFILSGLFLYQLLVPAALSLLLSGTPDLLRDFVRLAAWMIALLFSIAFHDTTARIAGTLETLQKCALFMLGGIVLFQVLQLGETAYGLGLLRLGGIKNEPSASMLALAFLTVFFVRHGRFRQIAGLTCLLILLVMLMKRSSVLVALIVIVLGARHVLLGKKSTRMVTYLAGSLIVVLALSYFDLGARLGHADLVTARFKDIEKLQDSQDLGYLGSGRMGLLELHWQSFVSRDLSDRLFGLTVTETQRWDTQGRYLGLGLPAAAHNDFMEVLTRGGFFGLATYVAFLTTLAAMLKKPALSGSDHYLRAAHYAGRAAGLAYLMHIFIGVIFKVQFMVVEAVLIGIAVRIGRAQGAKNDAAQPRPLAVIEDKRLCRNPG